MTTFWALVKNDFGIAKNYKKRNLFWKRFYFITSLLIGFILYTVLLLLKQVKPEFITFIPVFLIFIVFVNALSLVKREWSGNTMGWWLQLPYSRRFLLGAKLIASLIRYFRMILIVYIVSLFLFFEGMILCPDLWAGYSGLDIILTLGREYLQLLTFSPILAVYGIFLVVIKHTRYHFLTPIIWVVVGFFLSLIYSTFFNAVYSDTAGVTWTYSILGLSHGLTYLLGLIVVILVSVLIHLLSAFLLENRIEI